jgi:hypothetical protein
LLSRLDTYNYFSKYLPVKNFQDFRAEVVSIAIYIKNIALKILSKISQIPTKLSVLISGNSLEHISVNERSEMLKKIIETDQLSDKAIYQLSNRDLDIIVHLATQEKHTGMIEKIINRKSSVNKSNIISDILNAASRFGRIHIVKTILAKHKNPDVDYGNALVFAAINGYDEIVKSILTTIKITKVDLTRALAFATMCKDAKVVKTILENSEISTTDRSFALQLAYQNFSEETLKTILLSGAIFQENYNLLQEYATRIRQTNILEFLKQQAEVIKIEQKK